MADKIIETGDIQLDQNVVEETLKEIKSLGENTKKSYEDLRTSHNSLKETLEKGVEGNREKLVKLTSDIITRQEEIDKTSTSINERIDQVEVALKRPVQSAGNVKEELYEEAKKHMISCMVSRGEKPTFEKLERTEINVDNYLGYKKAFQTFLRRDERLINPEQQKALSVGVDPDGGYTVTPFMSSRILTKLYESDPIRQLASVESISTDAWEELIDWSEANCGWETETSSGGETTTPDFKRKRIPVHIMYAKPHATQQLLEDSSINVESWLANKIADRMMRREGAAFVEGDGIGKPRGFLTYANGTDYGQVEQVNMGAAAALTADGFIRVKYALQEFFLNRGTWLMNRLSVMEAMLLKNGAGDYIWKPGLTSDAQSTLVGLSLRMSTSMPQVAANTLSVALADWAEAYKIVDRLGITVQRDPYTAKPFVEFYTRKRLGGDLVNYDAIKIGKVSA